VAKRFLRADFAVNSRLSSGGRLLFSGIKVLTGANDRQEEQGEIFQCRVGRPGLPKPVKKDTAMG
jgi:hypothetical protein